MMTVVEGHVYPSRVLNEVLNSTDAYLLKPEQYMGSM
jgi:hypothetical protein